MSEDALTINVTAPNKPAALPRPVIVFIYGGGYIFGTSAMRLYSGTRSALVGDVVFVSFNYRLGAFGVCRLQRILHTRAAFRLQPGVAGSGGGVAVGEAQYRRVRRRPR